MTIWVGARFKPLLARRAIVLKSEMIIWVCGTVGLLRAFERHLLARRACVWGIRHDHLGRLMIIWVGECVLLTFRLGLGGPRQRTKLPNLTRRVRNSLMLRSGKSNFIIRAAGFCHAGRHPH